MDILIKIGFAKLFGDDPDRNLEYFLVSMILFFVFAAILFFSLLMYSRMRKIYVAKAIDLIHPDFESLLINYLFEGIELRELLASPAMKKALSRKWMRAVLLNEMLKLHDNFSGEYAVKLEVFYLEAGLINDSNKKLKSAKWHIKCKGIKELTQMHGVSLYAKILKYTHSKNNVLRREAQFSVLKMKGFAGLSFLENYGHRISEWEQLNFIAILSKVKNTDVPDLSALINSTNESLCIFAIRLVMEFNQASAIPAIEKRFAAASEVVKTVAIKALCHLHSTENAGLILNSYESGSLALKLQILDAIGNLGNEKHLEFVVSQTVSDNYHIKFHAVKALENIAGSTKLLKSQAEHDKELNRIVQHINDKRIHV